MRIVVRIAEAVVTIVVTVFICSTKDCLSSTCLRGQLADGDSDGRYTIVYNGEIYNFEDLRKVLSAKGRKFRTDSDTEVHFRRFRSGVMAALKS